jgi:hypothetical protein
LLKFPALPPPEPAASELVKGAAPDPLLEPAWSRAILTALTATWRDGEIDMFVIGKRDMEASAVSVRVHGKGNLCAKPRAETIAEILLSIKERRGEHV